MPALPPIDRSARRTARICRAPGSASFARNNAPDSSTKPQKLARNRLGAAGVASRHGHVIAGPAMQFLVYLTVLMVSISTVLLEVHWLTSPAPQPKPAVQADERDRRRRAKSKARPRRSARSIRNRRTQRPRRRQRRLPRIPRRNRSHSNHRHRRIRRPLPPRLPQIPSRKNRRPRRQALPRARRTAGNPQRRLRSRRKLRRRTIAATCRHVRVPINPSGPPTAPISHSRVHGGSARRPRCSAPRVTRASGRNGANGAGSGTSRRATAIVRLDGGSMMIPMKAMRMTMMTQTASAYSARAAHAGSARLRQFNR